MKTRILFIKYHEAADQQPLSKKAAEKLGIFPSLPLLSLAAWVRENGFQVDYIDRAIQDGREQRCVVRIVVNDEECGGRDTPLVVDLDRTVAGGDGSKLVAFGGDCVPGTYRVTRSSVVLVVELTADPGEFCGLLGGSDAALVVSQRLSEE